MVASLTGPEFPPPAAAETPSADFTFKRSRVPSPGTRKRITIQILPEAPARRVSRAVDPRPQPRIAFGFFWEAVPADRATPAAERLTLARQTLESARARGTPLFGHPASLERIAAAFGPEIARAAARHQVSEALLLAVILVESGGKVLARSPRDAQGLMQLIPATALRMGVTDPWDPAQNIDGGARYLAFLLDLFGGDLLLALAGYNAGEGAVIRNDGVPNHAETRDYVPKVLGAFLQARALCATPPESVRARCDLGAATTPVEAQEIPGVAPPIRFSRPG